MTDAAGADRDSSQSDRGPTERVSEARFKQPGTGWTDWVYPAGVVGLLVAIVVISVATVRADDTTITVLGREVAGLTAGYGLSLLTIGVVAAPVLRQPDRLRILTTRIRQRPVVLTSAVYVVILVAVTSVYGLRVDDPRVEPVESLQPPVWGSIPTAFVPDCVGSVVGEQCTGSLTYPLGTNPSGQDLLQITALGLNTSLQVAVTASVLAVSMGIAVGTVAGYFGGRPAELLMRWVDIQQSVPVFFVYVLLLLAVDRSYTLLVLVFGLLSWGGIARIIRGEVAQRREAPYIKAATLSGASVGRILRQHVIPNVASTVITAAAVLFTKFVVYEAALAFLSLTDPTVFSLGNELARAVGTETADPIARAQGGAPPWDWREAFYIVYVPGVALVSVLAAVGLLGDGLQDVIDPREG